MKYETAMVSATSSTLIFIRVRAALFCNHINSYIIQFVIYEEHKSGR